MLISTTLYYGPVHMPSCHCLSRRPCTVWYTCPLVINALHRSLLVEWARKSGDARRCRRTRPQGDQRRGAEADIRHLHGQPGVGACGRRQDQQGMCGEEWWERKRECEVSWSVCDNNSEWALNLHFCFSVSFAIHRLVS